MKCVREFRDRQEEFFLHVSFRDSRKNLRENGGILADLCGCAFAGEKMDDCDGNCDNWRWEK